MHIFVDPETALKCSVWPQFRYYLSIAGAIILEDLAIAGYKALRRGKGRRVVLKEQIVEGKSSSVAEKKHLDMRVRTDNPEKHEMQKVLEIQSKKFIDIPKDKPADDLFLKVVPWLGYLWVFFFEVWSCSKLLYLQKQCTMPSEVSWEWLAERLKSGNMTESDRALFV